MRTMMAMTLLAGLVATSLPARVDAQTGTSVKAGREKGKVDLDLKDGNLKDIVDALFKLKPDGPANKIVEPGPYKPVTLSLDNTDWDAALHYVL